MSTRPTSVNIIEPNQTELLPQSTNLPADEGMAPSQHADQSYSFEVEDKEAFKTLNQSANVMNSVLTIPLPTQPEQITFDAPHLALGTSKDLDHSEVSSDQARETTPPISNNQRLPAVDLAPIVQGATEETPLNPDPKNRSAFQDENISQGSMNVMAELDETEDDTLEQSTQVSIIQHLSTGTEIAFSDMIDSQPMSFSPSNPGSDLDGRLDELNVSSDAHFPPSQVSATHPSLGSAETSPSSPPHDSTRHSTIASRPVSPDQSILISSRRNEIFQQLIDDQENVAEGTLVDSVPQVSASVHPSQDSQIYLDHVTDMNARETPSESQVEAPSEASINPDPLDIPAVVDPTLINAERMDNISDQSGMITSLDTITDTQVNETEGTSEPSALQERVTLDYANQLKTSDSDHSNQDVNDTSDLVLETQHTFTKSPGIPEDKSNFDDHAENTPSHPDVDVENCTSASSNNHSNSLEQLVPITNQTPSTPTGPHATVILSDDLQENAAAEEFDGSSSPRNSASFADNDRSIPLAVEEPLQAVNFPLESDAQVQPLSGFDRTEFESENSSHEDPSIPARHQNPEVSYLPVETDPSSQVQSSSAINETAPDSPVGSDAAPPELNGSSMSDELALHVEHNHSASLVETAPHVSPPLEETVAEGFDDTLTEFQSDESPSHAEADSCAIEEPDGPFEQSTSATFKRGHEASNIPHDDDTSTLEKPQAPFDHIDPIVEESDTPDPIEQPLNTVDLPAEGIAYTKDEEMSSSDQSVGHVEPIHIMHSDKTEQASVVSSFLDDETSSPVHSSPTIEQSSSSIQQTQFESAPAISPESQEESVEDPLKEEVASIVSSERDCNVQDGAHSEIDQEDAMTSTSKLSDTLDRVIVAEETEEHIQAIPEDIPSTQEHDDTLSSQADYMDDVKADNIEDSPEHSASDHDIVDTNNAEDSSYSTSILLENPHIPPSELLEHADPHQSSQSSIVENTNELEDISTTRDIQKITATPESEDTLSSQADYVDDVKANNIENSLEHSASDHGIMGTNNAEAISYSPSILLENPHKPPSELPEHADPHQSGQSSFVENTDDFEDISTTRDIQAIPQDIPSTPENDDTLSSQADYVNDVKADSVEDSLEHSPSDHGIMDANNAEASSYSPSILLENPHIPPSELLEHADPHQSSQSSIVENTNDSEDVSTTSESKHSQRTAELATGQTASQLVLDNNSPRSQENYSVTSASKTSPNDLNHQTVIVQREEVPELADDDVSSSGNETSAVHDQSTPTIQEDPATLSTTHLPATAELPVNTAIPAEIKTPHPSDHSASDITLDSTTALVTEESQTVSNLSQASSDVEGSCTPLTLQHFSEQPELVKENSNPTLLDGSSVSDKSHLHIEDNTSISLPIQDSVESPDLQLEKDTSVLLSPAIEQTTSDLLEVSGTSNTNEVVHEAPEEPLPDATSPPAFDQVETSTEEDLMPLTIEKPVEATYLPASNDAPTPDFSDISDTPNPTEVVHETPQVSLDNATPTPALDQVEPATMEQPIETTNLPASDNAPTPEFPDVSNNPTEMVHETPEVPLHDATTTPALDQVGSSKEEDDMPLTKDQLIETPDPSASHTAPTVESSPVTSLVTEQPSKMSDSSLDNEDFNQGLSQPVSEQAASNVEEHPSSYTSIEQTQETPGLPADDHVVTTHEPAAIIDQHEETLVSIPPAPTVEDLALQPADNISLESSPTPDQSTINISQDPNPTLAIENIQEAINSSLDNDTCSQFQSLSPIEESDHSEDSSAPSAIEQTHENISSSNDISTPEAELPSPSVEPLDQFVSNEEETPLTVLPELLDSPKYSIISVTRPPVDPAVIVKSSSACHAVSNIQREIILPAKMKKISIISHKSSGSLVLDELDTVLTFANLDCPVTPPAPSNSSPKNLSSNVTASPPLATLQKADEPPKPIASTSHTRTQSLSHVKARSFRSLNDTRTKSLSGGRAKSLSGRKKLIKPYPSLKRIRAMDSTEHPQKRLSYSSVVFHSTPDASSLNKTNKTTRTSRRKSVKLGDFGLKIQESESHVESRNDLADAFAFIEMSETMKYSSKADRYVNPTLSRRLTKSVKDIFHKRHNRHLNKKNSPLDDIDIPADFHLDIDENMINIADEHDQNDAHRENVGVAQSKSAVVFSNTPSIMRSSVDTNRNTQQSHSSHNHKRHKSLGTR